MKGQIILFYIIESENLPLGWAREHFSNEKD